MIIKYEEDGKNKICRILTKNRKGICIYKTNVPISVEGEHWVMDPTEYIKLNQMKKFQMIYILN